MPWRLFYISGLRNYQWVRRGTAHLHQPFAYRSPVYPYSHEQRHTHPFQSRAVSPTKPYDRVPGIERFYSSRKRVRMRVIYRPPHSRPARWRVPYRVSIRNVQMRTSCRSNVITTFLFFSLFFSFLFFWKARNVRRMRRRRYRTRENRGWQCGLPLTALLPGLCIDFHPFYPFFLPLLLFFYCQCARCSSPILFCPSRVLIPATRRTFPRCAAFTLLYRWQYASNQPPRLTFHNSVVSVDRTCEESRAIADWGTWSAWYNATWQRDQGMALNFHFRVIQLSSK